MCSAEWWPFLVPDAASYAQKRSIWCALSSAKLNSVQSMYALPRSLEALALEPPSKVLLRRFPDALRAADAMGLALPPSRRQGLDANTQDARFHRFLKDLKGLQLRLPVETERRCSAEPDWCEEMDRHMP